MTGRFRQALLEKGTMPKKFSVKSGDKSAAGGLTAKGVKRYRAANPGSKLKTAVTTKPSKLKKGSKAASRRKSFCARMGGMKKRRTSAKTANDPNSRINKALRKWNCSTDVNPNALQAMSEAVHFRVFDSQLDERIVSLLECAVDSVDQVTDEMIEDALTIESILTPIVFEELSNPLNESVEDFDEVIIRRFDEAVNPAAIRVPGAYGAPVPSFRAGLKRGAYNAAAKLGTGIGRGLYDAGAKLSKGMAGGAYDAGARVTKDLARTGWGGVKNFYKGLSGDTPIGTRIGNKLRGGLSGLRRGFTKYGTPEGEGGGIGAATGRGLRRAGQATKSGIGKAFQAYKDTQMKPFGAEMERGPQRRERLPLWNADALQRNKARKTAARRAQWAAMRSRLRGEEPQTPKTDVLPDLPPPPTRKQQQEYERRQQAKKGGN